MDWGAVSRIPLKATLYDREVYFREGWADAQHVLGETTDQTLRNSAFVLIKPDGLKAGKTVPILEFLEAHEFSLIAVEQPQLGRFHWREMWRYQLTSATLDRLAANELVLHGQCLMLVVAQEPKHNLPATVRISSLKGPSQLDLQWPGCLRQVLGQPNRIFSHFHVADEPADFVRELAILLEQKNRLRVYAALKARSPLAESSARLLQSILASAISPTAFDAKTSLERVERACNESAELDARARTAIAVDVELMRQGHKINWLAFSRRLQPIIDMLDPWDLAMLASTHIVYDEPGFSKRIAAVDVALWSSI